jgi:hypothetical protein
MGTLPLQVAERAGESPTAHSHKWLSRLGKKQVPPARAAQERTSGSG